MPASIAQNVPSSASHAPSSTFERRPPPASTPQAPTTAPLRIVSTIGMSGGKHPLELRAISPENHGGDSDEGHGNNGDRRTVIAATKKGFLLTEGPQGRRRYVVACDAEREGAYDEDVTTTTSDDKAASEGGIASTVSADNDCESSNKQHTKATHKHKHRPSESESESIAVRSKSGFAIHRVVSDKASSGTSSTKSSGVGSGTESSLVPRESTGKRRDAAGDETSASSSVPAAVTSDDNGHNSSEEGPCAQPRKCSFDAPSEEANGDEGTAKQEEDDESKARTSGSSSSSSVTPKNVEGAGAEHPAAALSSRRTSLTGGNQEEEPSWAATTISDIASSSSAREATNAVVPKKTDTGDNTSGKDAPVVVGDDPPTTVGETGGSGKVSESDDAAEVAEEDEEEEEGAPPSSSSKTEPVRNCGECIYCLDKTRFGGQRRLRKACIRIQRASRASGKKSKTKRSSVGGRSKAGANAGAGAVTASAGGAMEKRSRSLRRRSARTFLRDEQAEEKGVPPPRGRRREDDPADERNATPPQESKSLVAPEPIVTTRQKKVVAPNPAPAPVPTAEEEAPSAPPSTKQPESAPPKKKRRRRDSKGTRINRCNNCAACARENCGKCVYCKDMKEFGGPQIKRKACVHRQCLNLKLDNNPDGAAPSKRPKKNSTPNASEESREGDGAKTAGGGLRDNDNARIGAPQCSNKAYVGPKDKSSSPEFSMSKHGSVSEDNDLAEADLSAAKHKAPAQGDNGKHQISGQDPALLNGKDASQANKSGRCGVCPGCNSVNCGECIYCKDMTQFGGPHRLRKACLRRRCAALRKKRRAKAASAKKELKKESATVPTRPIPNVSDEVKSVGSVSECSLTTGNVSVVVRKKKPPRLPRKKGERIVTPFQMLSEEISCVGRVSFFHTVDSDSESDEDSIWHDEYLNVSGVTRCDPTRSRCGKRSSSSVEVEVDDCAPRYKAKLSHQGTVLNLGSDHYSSAAAAAARDLANTLIRGSEDPRPLDVLSSKEAWTGLRSAGAPGVLPCGKVEPQSLRSTKRKVQFESLIENSLASIGGHDGFLAQVLASVDEEAAEEAASKDAMSVQPTAREAYENPRKAHRKDLLEGLCVDRKTASSCRDKHQKEKKTGKITSSPNEVSLFCTETCDDDFIVTVNTVRAPVAQSFIVWTEESLQCKEVLPGMEDDESSCCDLLDSDLVAKVQSWRRPGWTSRCSKSNTGNCGSCKFCTYLCTLYGDETKEIDDS